MPDIVPFPGAKPTQTGAKPAKPSKRIRPGWSRWIGVRGGRIFTQQDGSQSYYVERRVKGKRYPSVNLHATDPESAIANLREWERNKDGWTPHGHAPESPVLLDDALIQRFVDWCGEVPDGKRRRRNTDPRWIGKKAAYLAWFSGKVQGRNLRCDGSAGGLTTEEIRSILRGQPNWKQRLDALGSLYKYLRVGAPPALAVRKLHSPMEEFERPRPDPQQLTESKIDWTKEDCDKVIAWLEKQHSERRHPHGRDSFNVEEAARYLGLTPATVQAFAARGKIAHEGGGRGVPLCFHRRDLDAYDRKRAEAADVPRRVALVLRILGGTAWHVTEVVRFGRYGKVLELPPEHVRQNGAERGLVCFHKSGKVYPQAVSALVATAAQELLDLGGIEYDSVFRWVKKGVDATAVAKFTPGQFRHRQGSYQLNQGAQLKAIKEGLGHENEATSLVYVMRATPPKQKTWY